MGRTGVAAGRAAIVSALRADQRGVVRPQERLGVGGSDVQWPAAPSNRLPGGHPCGGGHPGHQESGGRRVVARTCPAARAPRTLLCLPVRGGPHHGGAMKVLVKSAWGSDDPTKAAFPFLHANALAEAGHEAQIFLLGEAVSLMREPVANAVVPVGWPPLAETLRATVALGIPIHV